MKNNKGMTREQIKEWYKKECNAEIPKGLDTSEEECLDYITRDCYAFGYNKARETTIDRAVRWLSQCDAIQNSSEVAERFRKEMED